MNAPSPHSSSVCSMTGFGAHKFSIATVGGAAIDYEIEIKSLNSRYVDLFVRLPKELSRYELDLRRLITSLINRGKVEITINRSGAASGTTNTLSDTTSTQTSPLVRAQFDRYVSMYRQLKEEFSTVGNLLSQAEIFFMLQQPGVVKNTSDDETTRGTEFTKGAIDVLLGATKTAVGSLITSRQEEGAALVKALRQYLGTIAEFTQHVKKQSEVVVELARTKLTARIETLLEKSNVTLDLTRVAQEVCMLADRSDITEEIVRIESHIASFNEKISVVSGPTGRELDFLCQELGREWNTIGSKSQSTVISSVVMQAKSTLEKIREQVQNVE